MACIMSQTRSFRLSRSAARTPIRPPRSRESIDVCPACGYSLMGSLQSEQCPECGMEMGTEAMMFTGVARGLSEGRPWRRWLMIGTVGLTVLQMYGCPLIIGGTVVIAGTSGSAMVIALVLPWLLVATGVVVLITSRKQGGGGVDQLFVGRRGFGLMSSLDCNRPDKGLTPWEGEAVEFRRLGKAWYRLRIGTSKANGRGVKKPRLDIGVRCPEEQADEVRRRLHECAGNRTSDNP